MMDSRGPTKVLSLTLAFQVTAMRDGKFYSYNYLVNKLWMEIMVGQEAPVRRLLSQLSYREIPVFCRRPPIHADLYENSCYYALSSTHPYFFCGKLVSSLFQSRR